MSILNYTKQDKTEYRKAAKWADNVDMKKWNKHMVSPHKSESLSDNNTILANGLKMSRDTQLTKLNNNTLVIGGSGTGKTFGFVKPNIAQMNASYVVTDPRGDIMSSTAKMLLENGYNFQIFSICDMNYSNCYNPFDHIYNEKGNIDESKAQALAYTLYKCSNNRLRSKCNEDKYWEKNTIAWLEFAILFLAEIFPAEKRNMASLLKLAQMGKADEDSRSSDSSTELDKIVAVKRAENPKAKCFLMYDTFNLAPAKTRNSILISICIDLNLFANNSVRNITSTSYIHDSSGFLMRDKKTVDAANPSGVPIKDSKNIDFYKLCSEKTVLFITIPLDNNAYNIIVSVMLMQLTSELYMIAEKLSPNKYHVLSNDDETLSAMYPSFEAAAEAANLFKNATVVSIPDKNGVPQHYIYNEDATKEFSLNEEYNFEKKYKGCMKKVYSVNAGKSIIQKYKNAKVVLGQATIPVEVQLIMEDFTNWGYFPSFPETIATMRKYGIGVTATVQSLASLNRICPNNVYLYTIEGFDTIVFFGSSDRETDIFFSKRLGKLSIKKQGCYLMDPNEKEYRPSIAVMPYENCIVIVRGHNPFYMKKFWFSDHPNFKLSGDADKSLRLDKEFLINNFKCNEDKDKEELIIKEKTPSIQLKKVVQKPKKDVSINDLADFLGVERKNVIKKVLEIVENEIK